MKLESKPRLLVLTSSFPSSPSDETCGYVRDFAESLSASFEVTVLAPNDSSDDSNYRSFNVVRARPPFPGLFRSSRSGFRATADLNDAASGGLVGRLDLLPGLISFAIRALCLAMRSDVICSHWMIPAGVISAICSKALGKRHITVEHSGALHFLRKSATGKLLARFVVRNSKAVVVVSEDLGTKLLEFCPEAEPKTVVVPMGIEIDRLTPPPEGGTTNPSVPVQAFSARENGQFGIKTGAGKRRADASKTVAFVGRLVKIKGVDVLLRAAAQTDHLRVVIAGDGPERPRLERLAAELGVDAVFKGAVGGKDKSELYARADAIVIPSLVLDDGRTEGTPRVCLEAMASGRPVVASRCGGLSELIVDGENGLLFEPGDDQTLGDRLQLVMRDPDLARRLSEEGRRTAARYDWSIVGRNFCLIMQGETPRELMLLRAMPG